MKHKLGVVVPYRKRFQQLVRFLDCVPSYLRDHGIDHEIIVVEQLDKEGFNRGALLNVGFLEAKKQGCDYVVFHDVDLLPKDVDYSYADTPLELVDRVIDDTYEENFQIQTDVEKLTYDYFGGVTLFPVECFEKINGYSNRYVGWGFEDNDLLFRCREAQVPLGFRNYRQYSTLEPALTFNGFDSYATIPVENLQLEQISFLVTFRVEDFKVGEDLQSSSVIFWIPELKAKMSYTAFGTYKFELQNSEGREVCSAYTKKQPLGLTVQAIVSLDFQSRYGILYVNGQEVGKFNWPETLSFSSMDKVYLGTESLLESEYKHLRGQISEFAIFNNVISQKSALEIFQKGYLGLGEFCPRQWYLGRTVRINEILPNLTDLGKSLDGKIQECLILPLVSPEYFYRESVPIKRSGVFIGQPHESNGWKSQATTLNQMRYRDVEVFGSSQTKDGLSSVSKVILSVKKAASKRGITRLQVTFKK